MEKMSIISMHAIEKHVQKCKITLLGYKCITISGYATQLSINLVLAAQARNYSRVIKPLRMTAANTLLIRY